MKRNSGEIFTPRWKTQTNTSCSVPFCSQRSAINNHPFCWNKICSAVGVASVEFDETKFKPSIMVWCTSLLHPNKRIVSSMWIVAANSLELPQRDVYNIQNRTYTVKTVVCYAHQASSTP